ncbi:hypothetical protein [Yoonia sp. 2307UL14-13]|uniref:hypothetical protein n=1 Tax=Yoonia sp. 2307UL14-13 TaxID=3126506 RepID=UPI0030AFBA1D
MPIILALIGAATAFYFLVIRARNAADIATDVVDMANDVRLAARRFGFKRRTNLHPVESIEDPNLAISAIALSFLELNDLPTQEQRNAMVVQSQSVLDVSKIDAEEMMVLGRWFMSECGGPDAAISRISRKLCKIDPSGFDPLMGLVKAVLPDDGLNDKQRDALDDIKRAFRIR